MHTITDPETKLSSGFLLFSGKRLLLLKRAEKSGNGGTWGVPGGKRDPDEASYAAALREAKEELGKVPKHAVVGQLGIQRINRRFEMFAIRSRKRIRQEWKPTLNHEHDDFRWATLEWCQTNQDKLHPVVKLLLEDSEGSDWLEAMFDTKCPKKLGGALRATDYDTKAKRPWT
jgi:8-oxo-dGTP pyrophosphatase MutT (NUDIX family)